MPPLRYSPLLISIAAAACATTPPQQGPSRIAEPKTSASPYDAYITVSSATFGLDPSWGAPTKRYLLLTTIDKKTGATTRGLVFSHHYDESRWRFWSTASTSNAEPLRILSTKRDIGRCSPASCFHDEIISAEIPDPIAQTAATAGLAVRFRSASGSEQYIYFNPAAVAELLALEKKAASSLDSR